MDENMDFLNSEFDAEDNTTTYTETDSLLETTPEPSPPKKKRLIQVPIIISMIIVLVIAASLVLFKGFFDKSILGTWHFSQTIDSQDSSASADEPMTIDVYYVFDSDNTVKECFGTLTSSGTYTIEDNEAATDENSKDYKILSMDFQSYQYMFYITDLSGNMFTGRTISLAEYYSNTEYKWTSASDVVKPELKPEKEFKANKDLTGSWSTDTEYGSMTYTFNDDGTVNINDSNIVEADGIYSYDENTINITYYTSSEVPMTLYYTVEDDGITLNGIQYTKADGNDTSKTDTTAATDDK